MCYVHDQWCTMARLKIKKIKHDRKHGETIIPVCQWVHLSWSLQWRENWLFIMLKSNILITEDFNWVFPYELTRKFG